MEFEYRTENTTDELTRNLRSELPPAQKGSREKWQRKGLTCDRCSGSEKKNINQMEFISESGIWLPAKFNIRNF